MKFLSSHIFSSTFADWQKYIKSFKVLKSLGLETFTDEKGISLCICARYSINLGDFLDIFS